MRCFLFLLLFSIFAAGNATAQEQIFSDEIIVIDGDSFFLGDFIIHLVGIDAMEGEQTCLEEGKTKDWECGSVARDVMRSVAQWKLVTCSIVAKGSAGVLLFARCGTDKTKDLGEYMVALGLAIATHQDYKALEQSARRNKIGIWAGTFEKPEKWRARHQ